jgi:uncharacterized protein YcbK (DUF882 family)
LTSTERSTDRRHLNSNAWPKWLAGIMVAFSFMTIAAPAAHAETRTLKLYFIHTKERAEITFKRNGRYDQAGLKKINNLLRDWRRNEPTKMDPRLLDIVWESYKSVGARDYIHVVSAYRSPATNSMLRKRSKGVANKSQHMLGKAMDFYIPGVNLKKLRDAGLRAQAGGVGYYPRSGSPFVHLDVGSVRHWPRMSRKELVSVFPSGKTLHVPSDGKPLPGFDTALASYEARKKKGGTALALASSGKSKSGGLLAALFGGGADEEEDAAVESVASAKPSKPAKPVAEPVAEPRNAKASGRIKIVPPDQAEPAMPSYEAEQPIEETPETIIASLPARSIPVPGFAPRPKTEVGATDLAENVPFGMAQAAPDPGQPTVPGDPTAPFEVAAANVPLPTWRPDFTPPNIVADEQAPMLLALASTEASAQAAIAVPLPQSRPAGDEFFVASLPEAGASTERLPQTVPASIEKAEAVEAQVKANNARLAVLTDNAPANESLATAPGATAAAELFQSGAKTTRKSARAKLKDTKPAPKPVVIAAQPEAARWALSGGGYVVAPGGVAGADPVAHQVVRAAPTEVYATSFTKEDPQVADAGRFTGRAVSFLPVARFVTN